MCIRDRSIEVYELSLLSYDKRGEAVVIFECSKGGYVRSIARDLGDFLGCFGYVKNLIRTEYGPFNLTEAVHLPDLLDFSKENLYSHLKGIEAGIPSLKSFECNVDDLKHLEHGRPIKCPITINISEGEEVVAKHEGRVAGILFKDGFFLKVRRKLNT